MDFVQQNSVADSSYSAVTFVGFVFLGPLSD